MTNPLTISMKNILFTLIVLAGYTGSALAQTPVITVNKVIGAEESFNKLVARKGIKDAFLEVADPEGIVFKPNAVKIADFYANIDKQPGILKWEPKFARVSAAGDLAFTAGPYVYQNGKSDDDKVFGDYVSIWRADGDNKFKLLIDLGIQHPEAEQEATTDFKDPEPLKGGAASKDPFNGKNIILGTDKTFNHTASTISTFATYKEFLSVEGRFYFPGFEPIVGQDKILKFIENEAISVSAETVSGGRSLSNDLAYTYGHARIKKGNIVSNFNYVRIWEIDKTHKWNILLEVFSAVENE
jgi:hypothetical protein